MKINKNIIVIGPPGSGKGTQAKMLAEQYELVHYEQGQLLRDEVAQQTVIGEEIKDLINKGKLVSGEIIEIVLNKYLDTMNPKKHIMFDGVPRTMNQVGFFHDSLAMHGLDNNIVLYFYLSNEESRRRLLGRAEQYQNEGQDVRIDDSSLEIIETRITEYNNRTKPLIEHYTKQNMLITIDVSQGISEVNNAVHKALKSFTEV